MKRYSSSWETILSNCYSEGVEKLKQPSWLQKHHLSLSTSWLLLRHRSGVTRMAQEKATADAVCGVCVLRCDGVLWECLPDQALRGLKGTSLLPELNSRYLVSCSDLSKQTLLHLQRSMMLQMATEMLRALQKLQHELQHLGNSTIKRYPRTTTLD